jgi:hypothetical protein
MGKIKSINESLAESLRNAVPAKAPEEAIADTTPVVDAPIVEKKALPKSPELPPTLLRTTISMKATEQDRVDQILEVLKKCRRYRGGVTEAINIALRLCPLDEEHIGKVWDESRAEDKRTKKMPKT